MNGRRRIRVLTIVDYVQAGGAERMATSVAMALDPRRFESVVCSTRPSSGAEVDRLRSSGLEYIALDRSSRRDLRPWPALVRRLRRRPPDVIHAHEHGSNLWGVLLRAATASPRRRPVLVSTEHTWSFEGDPRRQWRDRNVIARFSNAFVAVSEEDRRRMIAIEGIAPARLRMIPTAYIPRDGSVVAGPPVREEIGAGPGDPLIVTMCALRPQKALDVLIGAMPEIRRHVPAARLVIAGDGPERPALERLAAAVVPGAVHFLGWRDDAEAVVAAADVVASSSDFEGTPLALLEAMAVGRPIVATAVGGVPDLLARGEAGLIVPPRDESALAAAVAGLLQDPARQEHLGAAARARVDAQYRLDAVVGQWQDLYEELVSSGGARRG